MELVVLVAIAVLLIIFVGSLLALILLCRHRRWQQQTAGYLNEQKPMLKYSRDAMSDVSGFGHDMQPAIESDIDDMLQLSPNIAKVLQDNDWIYDASGLVHHSLAILRICHQIADQLSGLHFNPVPNNQDAVQDVHDWTRRIMPRVDDLVRTVKRGVHTSLLEARAAALVMSVSGVSTAFRAAYPRAAGWWLESFAAGELQWLRAAIADMEVHLEALRLAAEHEENAAREKCELIMHTNDDADDDGGGVNAGASTSGLNVVSHSVVVSGRDYHQSQPQPQSSSQQQQPPPQHSASSSGASTPTITITDRTTNHESIASPSSSTTMDFADASAGSSDQLDTSDGSAATVIENRRTDDSDETSSCAVGGGDDDDSRQLLDTGQQQQQQQQTGKPVDNNNHHRRPQLSNGNDKLPNGGPTHPLIT